LLLAADEQEALLSKIDAYLDGQRPATGSGKVRLALVNPTGDRLLKAKQVVQKGTTRRGRDGLWFTREGLLVQGKLAFLFPGIEAVFEPKATDLADWLGIELHDSLKEEEASPENERRLERTGMGVVTLGRMLSQAFGRLGIAPDAMAGHSIGEWSAMVESQMIPPDAADAFINSLAPGDLEVPGVVFVAVGAGIEKVTPLLAGFSDIAISHDNCPHQVILCGQEKSAEKAIARLTEERILCRKLPFRSGFHSPLFSDYLKPHLKNLSTLEFQSPLVPVWSATTASPYPDGTEEIRTLAAEHLVKPVEFRRLIEGMYDSGVRAFVQLGCGSLAGFVSDTLRGREHLSISANVTQRSGLDQLQRVAAALFVEGREVDWSSLLIAVADTSGFIRLSLGVPLVRLDTPLQGALLNMPVDAGSNPVMAEFHALMGDIQHAGTEVYQAWKGNHLSREEEGKKGSHQALDQSMAFSVESHPDLLDHCFFRQPAGWESVADRYPVVPLTMTLELMIEVALSMAAPSSVAVGMSAIRAYKWIAVHPPVEVEVSAKWVGPDDIHVVFHGYAEGIVHVAQSFEEAPQIPSLQLENERAVPISAEQLYADRWMFHGPAYQGVSELQAMSEKGIRGTLNTGAAKGALLDNAGQLFGLWIMLNTDINRLAMPVKVDAIRFYDHYPQAGRTLECRVEVTQLAAREVRCDMVLHSGGKIWATISGWEDWRFETDERLWPIMRYPERHLYGEISESGYCIIHSQTRSAASQDYLSRRFLCEAERRTYEELNERRQAGWLLGRIAAKDALRHWVQAQSGRQLFPAEVQIGNDPDGRPTAVGPFEAQLAISIAHKEDVAVALVAQDCNVGIDIERIESRTERFLKMAFHESELELLPKAPAPEWHTRLWSAKEALGKARGTGLAYNPRSLKTSEVDGERFCVDGVWVETRVDGEFVVAWTTL
jgi:malonyl CoA-acyl carrier protein transacylase/phosphopantetheinyl transferase